MSIRKAPPAAVSTIALLPETATTPPPVPSTPWRVISLAVAPARSIATGTEPEAEGRSPPAKSPSASWSRTSPPASSSPAPPATGADQAPPSSEAMIARLPLRARRG